MTELVVGEHGPRPVARPWRILSAAVVLQTCISTAEMGLPTLTVFIKNDLRLSASTAGLAATSYMAGKIGGSYPAGRLADRIGEARLLVSGAIATGVVLIVAMLLPYPVFMPMLMVAGLMSAASTPAGGSLIRSTFPPAGRGTALSLRQTGIPFGGLIAAALLPWIAHAYSWRWAVVVAACITMAGSIPLLRTPAAWVLPPARPKNARPHGKTIPRDVRFLTFWGVAALTGQFGLLTFMPLDLVQRAHLTLAAAASYLGLVQGSGIVGRLALGWLSDRMVDRGRKPLLSAAAGGMLLAVLGLVAMPASAPLALFLLLAALAGLTLIGFQGVWITMVTEAANPDAIGEATGFAVAVGGAGAAISPLLLGVVADLTGTYRAVWAMIAVLLLVGLVPLFAVGRKTQARSA